MNKYYQYICMQLYLYMYYMNTKKLLQLLTAGKAGELPLVKAALSRVMLKMGRVHFIFFRSRVDIKDHRSLQSKSTSQYHVPVPS